MESSALSRARVLARHLVSHVGMSHYLIQPNGLFRIVCLLAARTATYVVDTGIAAASMITAARISEENNGDFT
jgi:hypothetical protein